jgi:hypothetical protein
MKTTLFLSTIAAGLFAASTTFAQGYGAMPQAEGDAAAALQNRQYAAPYDGGQITRSRAGRVHETAPGQDPQ